MDQTGRPGAVARRAVLEVVDGHRRSRPDSLVSEEPMEIRLAWPDQSASRVAVVMRTPGHDFELATGFLLSEGVGVLGEAPRTVAYCLDRTLSAVQEYNVVTVTLERRPAELPANRTTAVSSACGVCGVQSLEEVFAPTRRPLKVSSVVDAGVIPVLPDLLRDRQRVFASTGSIHAAGIFDFAGHLVVAREDVGRHNCTDKVLGARQLGVVDYGDDAILCVSGRIGFDIAVKAVAGRIPVIVGVGGPSSLAVDLATRAGITVCGFTRGQRYVVYSHADRLS